MHTLFQKATYIREREDIDNIVKTDSIVNIALYYCVFSIAFYGAVGNFEVNVNSILF